MTDVVALLGWAAAREAPFRNSFSSVSLPTSRSRAASVATCRATGEYIGSWLTASGWALNDPRYSRDYVDEEAAARLGIWRGAFVPPWDWRAGQRAPSAGVDTDPPHSAARLPHRLAERQGLRQQLHQS
jgi:hypothetical protein